MGKVSVNKYGSKFWTLNDVFHREDGPAIEFANGWSHWFLRGKRHREGGPAIEWNDDDSKSEWYLNDRRVPGE